jgi:hexosaminidase
MSSDLYPHRGFMLDTGRKFFPVRAILDLLTVLHQYNFNIFHWHIYDAESFPIHRPADSGLTNTSMEHSHTADCYTLKDIQGVISHARRLGILVYPETDMPGHSDIW